jgi:hypothetical protein
MQANDAHQEVVNGESVSRLKEGCHEHCNSRIAFGTI